MVAQLAQAINTHFGMKTRHPNLEVLDNL